VLKVSFVSNVGDYFLIHIIIDFAKIENKN
jgi:hypothetical protein